MNQVSEMLNSGKSTFVCERMQFVLMHKYHWQELSEVRSSKEDAAMNMLLQDTGLCDM